jgi:hypothetical protein
MGLAELTDSEAVRKAVAEFDELGRDGFLRKYGFGPARSYFLVVDGKRYDSKAIVGAAHGFQFPDRGPLRPNEFSGGESTVRAKLEQLGFTVQVSADGGEESFLGTLGSLKVTTLPDGRSAPHKPLLVLFALGRAQQGLVRLTPFAELESPLRTLMSAVGVSSEDPLPDPYWRLQNDGDVWEVCDGAGPLRDRYPGTDPPARAVLNGSNGGFTEDVFDLLEEPGLVEKAAGLVARTYFPGLEEQVLAAAGIVGVRVADRRVWWVNQGATYQAERSGGFVWAPQRTRSGGQLAHHVNVSRLRPGDVILHYANGLIRAVSEVSSPPVEAERPAVLPSEAWTDSGYLCEVQYFDLSEPIRKEELDRPVTAGPFDRNGNVT